MDKRIINPKIAELAGSLSTLDQLRPSHQESNDGGEAHPVTLHLRGPGREHHETTIQLQPHERLVQTHNRTAYAVIGDTHGNERYRIRIYSATSESVAMIHDEAPITPRVHAFGNGLLWIRRDAKLRPHQALWLSAAEESPSLVLEEPDRTRRLVVRAVSDSMAILVSRSAKSSTHWELSARPSAIPACRKLETNVEDADVVVSRGSLAVLDRTRSKLIHLPGKKAPYAAPSPGFLGQRLQSVGDTLVVVGRNNGRMSIWAPDLGATVLWNAPHAGIMLPSTNTDNGRLSFLVSSPIHRPQAIFASVGEELQPTSTGRADAHALSAEGEDGIRIPVTLFLPPGAEPRPVVVHVYGAYGISLEGPYDPFTDHLLSRGIAVAYCHVRGGGEYGPSWHHQAIGRRHHRSVEDLLVSIDLLRRHPQIDAKRIALTAASAGGLIAATACLNEPSWLRALYLVNPFLDPVAALRNPDANLTTTDWAEFGNPGNNSGDRLMLEHISPMEIVGGLPPHGSPLPRAWIRGAINDSRVDTGSIEKFSHLYRKASLSVESMHVVCRISTGGHVGGVSINRAHNESLLAHAWLIEELGA